MPAPVDELHLLALLTRVRQELVDGGVIKPSRLHDLRAYKCVLAELAYLRRLAHAARTGGTIVTSMPQLVAGLARLHPAWRIDGDKFADRDRHHRSVRRRLRDLQAMGVLHWTRRRGRQRRGGAHRATPAARRPTSASTSSPPRPRSCSAGAGATAPR